VASESCLPIRVSGSRPGLRSVVTLNCHHTGQRASPFNNWRTSLDQSLSRYREPSPVRSITDLALVALWSTAWFTFSLGHSWASLLMAVPTAGFLVRLFMIRHDCGHVLSFHLDGRTIALAAHRRVHIDVTSGAAPTRSTMPPPAISPAAGSAMWIH